MSDGNDLAQAQESVKRVLDALGILRVVSVDDSNGKGVSFEDVVAAASVLEPPNLLSALPELGEEVPNDYGVLRQKIRDVWDRMDAEDQKTRSRAVLIAARRLDGGSTDDQADSWILTDLVPADKLTSLSPKQWEDRREQLLSDSKTQRTLFLFDQDFSETAGESDAGTKIIASLIAKDDTGQLICGLLTHTVTPDTQLDKWYELSSAYGIPRDRFIVITKQYLSQEPILFARALKFVALSPEFAQLKAKTKSIITQAAETAAARVENINIYDLDHIVFQVSLEEGLWEPDMLFRLHALFHRLASRRLAHEGGELERIAAKLRTVSVIPTNLGVFSPASSSWALQREELYESGEYINNNHLPLELGDIFERVGASSDKKYILLAQPCDLMVRADGKRHPELDLIPLIEVVYKDEAPLQSEELPYFNQSQSTKRWFVRFKLVHFVQARILDLCVLNTDGIAKITVPVPTPPSVRPAWQKRFEQLGEYWTKAIGRTSKLTVNANDSSDVKQLKQQISAEVKSLLFDDMMFKGILTENNGGQALTFDCRRVGRLSRTRAIGLLMSYTATLGRPAHDREFGSFGA